MYGFAKFIRSLDNSILHPSYDTKAEHLNANLLLLHKPKHGKLFIKGRHCLVFNFPLPSSLPATFISSNGCVKYKMLICVKRFAKSDMNFEFPFIVTQIVNLNEIPNIERPLLRLTSKEFTLDFTSKCLYMTAVISQQGFTPNQIIDVKTTIDNRSMVFVKFVKISLKKIVEFVGAGGRRLEATKAAVYCGSVPSHEKRLFVKYLKVPPLLPNINNCEILRVNYEVQVKAKTAGATRSPTVRLPIQIGTIGLIRDSQIDYEMDMRMPTRLEIAPMSYDACMASTSNASTPDVGGFSDLIDFSESFYDFY